MVHVNPIRFGDAAQFMPSLDASTTEASTRMLDDAFQSPKQSKDHKGTSQKGSPEKITAVSGEQDNIFLQQSLGDIFEQIKRQMEQQRGGLGQRSRPAEREMQENGCYSSPAYENIIDQIAQTIYDPRTMGNLKSLKHRYDCQIKSDSDAILYAHQAMKSFGDPFTQMALNEQVFKNRFGMIGVSAKAPDSDSSKPKSGNIVVDKITPDSPADRAGIKPGDTIVKVDGVALADKDQEVAKELIRGPADTEARLTIIRGGVEKEIVVRREAYKPEVKEGADKKNDQVNMKAGVGITIGLLDKDGHTKKEGWSGKIAEKPSPGKATENDLVVASIIPGGPAEKAGLRRGDVIRAVDGNPAAGKTMDDMVGEIRGPSGRAVELSILRGGKEMNINIIRELLNGQNVVTDKQLGDGISYITYSDFSHPDGNKALQEAMKRHSSARAIILDLRDNPGGELGQTIANLQMFAWEVPLVTIDGRVKSPPEKPLYETNKISVTGTTVVQTIETPDGKVEKNEAKRTVPYLLNGRPLVILVSGNSASASELFTGSLHDNGIAKVVGEKTYGKGIGQMVAPSADQSFQLRVTQMRYYTPRGTWLGDAHKDRRGIKPDYEVKDDLSLGDPQLDTAIDILKKRLATGK